MASQKAKQMDFLLSGISNSSGQPYKAGIAYFWESSAKTTAKTVWGTRNKTSPVTQVTLGNRGEATIFGDGEYYIEVYDSSAVLVKTYNLLNYSAEVDFGGIYIDVGASYGFTGPNVQSAIDDLDSSLNYVFLFKDGEFTISQNVILPTNAIPVIHPTATLAISNTFTLTVNAQPNPMGDFEAFTGTGTLAFGANVKFIDDDWYASGLTITNSAVVKVEAETILYDRGIAQKTVATITAGTTQTQAGATALTGYVNEVSVCANDNDGVKLVSFVAGVSQTVINNTTNICKVWPNTSDNIGMGVDLGESLLPGETGIWTPYDTTNAVRIKRLRYFQRKFLSSNVTSDGVISDLSFTLTEGRTYKITLQYSFDLNVSSTDGNLSITIKDGATVIGKVQDSSADTARRTDISGRTYIVTMSGTSLTFVAGETATANSRIVGDGTAITTWAEVEECENLMAGTVT